MASHPTVELLSVSDRLPTSVFPGFSSFRNPLPDSQLSILLPQQSFVSKEPQRILWADPGSLTEGYKFLMRSRRLQKQKQLFPHRPDSEWSPQTLCRLFGLCRTLSTRLLLRHIQAVSLLLLFQSKFLYSSVASRNNLCKFQSLQSTVPLVGPILRTSDCNPGTIATASSAQAQPTSHQLSTVIW